MASPNEAAQVQQSFEDERERACLWRIGSFALRGLVLRNWRIPIAFEKTGARCVFSSDYDKFSQQTYEANFGEKPHGDIHSVAVGDIQPHDILCAGFPCQPFSIAGVSKKLSLGRKHVFLRTRNRAICSLRLPISSTSIGLLLSFLRMSKI